MYINQQSSVYTETSIIRNIDINTSTGTFLSNGYMLTTLSCQPLKGFDGNNAIHFNNIFISSTIHINKMLIN